MKKSTLLSFLFMLMLCGNSMADDMRFVKLDALTHGTTINGPGAGLRLFDDGGSTGDYSGGYDYYCQIHSTCDSSCQASTFLCIMVKMTDIAPCDTLYIYDGPTPTGDPLLKINNSYASSDSRIFFASPSNRSRSLCVRFFTCPRHDSDSTTMPGFELWVDCQTPCENVIGVIDDQYEILDQEGNVLGEKLLKLLPTSYDTVFDTLHRINPNGKPDIVLSNRILRIDTTSWVRGVELCQGQGLRLHGHGEYSHSLGYYFPTDEYSTFLWTMGTGDERQGVNLNAVQYFDYRDPRCYDVTLSITDSWGCEQSNFEKIQIRLAPNPIKTIFDLGTICSTDSLMVSVGYDNDNSTLKLRRIEYQEVTSKTYSELTFIPDGPLSGVLCYSAPVTFNEFPMGRQVESANDICSICVNFEHSFMGDYSLAITCPTYDPATDPNHGIAYLKYKSRPDGVTLPDGTWGGGATITGGPWGAPNFLYGDDRSDAGNPMSNPYGIGLDYCFSHNGNYTLVTGESCDDPTLSAGLASSGHTIVMTATMPIPPAGYSHAGEVLGERTWTAQQPSDHDNKSDYYLPADDFSSLIGCPLNGTWSIQICDNLSRDNGWVFNWSMDICQMMDEQCRYQVGIDKVDWEPVVNPETDHPDGVYHGLVINKKADDPMSGYVSTTDTAGDFGIKISLLDDFGCVWDTLTHISSIYTPKPQLGDDQHLCVNEMFHLNAYDPHSQKSHFSYLWNRSEETTPTLSLPAGNTTLDYIVEVENRSNDRSCIGRDTVTINIKPSPIINFELDNYPAEGCEPLVLNIHNRTRNGYKYRWDFGDGYYSVQENPSHTYAAGTYDVTVYVESQEGCRESLTAEKMVDVFPSPKPDFSWEPAVPTVSNPQVTFINNTDNTNQYIYRWEVQYSQSNPYSVHTLTETNPSFLWTAGSSKELVGSYTARLIARSENVANTGRIFECSDTTETQVTIVNDQLVFGNIVTPNGDGLNDRFEIKNLVEGRAYPINELEIYNSIGVRIYHVENIVSSDQFWDPRVKNHPAGTYYYHFRGRGPIGNVERHGVIEVLK